MIRDNDIIDIFKKHDGVALEVTISSGKVFKVLNIAWGYDDGDEYSHISTNISPSVDGYDFDLFYSNEISKIYDPSKDKILFKN